MPKFSRTPETSRTTTRYSKRWGNRSGVFLHVPRVFRGGGFSRRRRQPHLCHAEAVDRLDAHSSAFDLNGVADPRAASQAAEHVAADRGVSTLVDVQPELLIRAPRQREPADAGGSIGPDDGPRLRAHRARNLADDPLHK